MKEIDKLQVMDLNDSYNGAQNKKCSTFLKCLVHFFYNTRIFYNFVAKNTLYLTFNLFVL